MANPEKFSDDMMEQVAGGITEDQALAAALAHANLRRDQIDYVKHIELDYEHGRKIYEVRFFKGGYEYEYDIDADNGQIVKFEKDFDD